MTRRAVEASTGSMVSASLSAKVPNSRVSSSPVSARWTASASAPAGLCAASRSTAPLPGSSMRSSRPGHRQRATPSWIEVWGDPFPALFHENFGGQHRQGEVDRLVRTRQGGDQVVAMARGFDDHVLPPACDRLAPCDPRQLRRRQQPRPDLRCCRAQGSLRLLRTRPHHRRPVRPQDARLLARDGGERRAQEGGVIEADRRDHGEHRLGDVGRVQPAAHADLEHRQVHPLSREEQERRHGQCLEVGGWTTGHRLAGRHHLTEQLSEARAVDRRTVDAQPFLDLLEMG